LIYELSRTATRKHTIVGKKFKRGGKAGLAEGVKYNKINNNSENFRVTKLFLGGAIASPISCRPEIKLNKSTCRI